jgi:AcrR family transcriptional regulator
MGRARAEDYHAKRTVILRRSSQLFALHGFSATSIAMIAEACGRSKALIFHYYADKESLLFDIIFTHLKELIAAVNVSAKEPGKPADRLHFMTAALLDAYRDADAEHQVQISSLKMLSPERQQRVRAMERVLVNVFADAIARAVPVCRDKRYLKPITMSLFGMLNWHYLWFREGKGLTRDDYARLVCELILVGAADAVPSQITRAHRLPKQPASKSSAYVRSSSNVRAAVRQRD